MNTKKYLSLIALLFIGISLTSCEAFDEFLDEIPDNRTELDTEEKIIYMLVSAYSENTYIATCEFSSDNIDLLNVSSPSTNAYIEELANWEDVTSTSNDDPSRVWEANYYAIAVANEVIKAVDEFEGEVSDNLLAAKGEALMCRAFAHFILVNTFCQAYHPDYADTDLGITYMEEAENTLIPQYERASVAENYASMAADIELGLTLVSDNISTVPSYHFGTKAANAFAARFYLFYQQYEKAIECATKVLGSSPASELRDLVANSSFGYTFSDYNYYATEDYVSSTHSCNLLLQTSYSGIGLAFGPYSYETDYNHGWELAMHETFLAQTAIWGAYSSTSYINQFLVAWNKSNITKYIAPRIPYYFQYTDQVAGIGYYRAVQVSLTTDEALLIRAEANALLGNFDDAIDDLNIWIANYLVNDYTLTETKLTAWAAKTAYYTPDAPTIKKEFEQPTMTIAAGTQENLMHIVSHCRRIETAHMGLRWFDVKRWGYTIYRRSLGDEVANYIYQTTVLDQLSPRDPRYAIQIPTDVVLAGYEPNPR